MLNFEDVLALARRGHRIKREDWSRMAIAIYGTRFLIHPQGEPYPSIANDWLPCASDLLAGDWRVELLPGEGVQEALPLGWR